MKTRLVIIEGASRDERSAAAEYIANRLQQNGIGVVRLDAETDRSADCENESADWAERSERLADKWRNIVNSADKTAVYIADGTLLGDGAAELPQDDVSVKYLRQTAQIIAPLCPAVIYLPTAGESDDANRRKTDLLGKAEWDLTVVESSDNDAMSKIAAQIVKRNGASAVKKEIWRAVKFTLFSISAGVIQLVSSLLLKLLILDYVIDPDAQIIFITPQPASTFIADTVGLALSVLWNFTFNRKFTFKAASNVPLAMLLAFLFYVPFYPFQTWYVPMVERNLTNLGDWGYIIGLGTCMIINFVLEFLWQQFVVFRGKVDTNERARTDGKRK